MVPTSFALPLHYLFSSLPLVTLTLHLPLSALGVSLCRSEILCISAPLVSSRVACRLPAGFHVHLCTSLHLSVLTALLVLTQCVSSSLYASHLAVVALAGSPRLLIRLLWGPIPYLGVYNVFDFKGEFRVGI